MLLFINNLPSDANITRVKQLIKDNCNISEVIVDNIIKQGQSRRVTIGLADSSDAAVLMEKLDGLFINGHRLQVAHVRQNKQSDYPFCPPMPSSLQPSQHVISKRRPMQVPHVPIQPAPTSVRVPMRYSNVPFYTPNKGQRNYVGNDTTAPLVNAPGQEPFYHQDKTRFKSNNPNQQRAKAFTYSITGITQKVQEPFQEPLNVGYDSPREQESNWRNRNENHPQNSSMMNTWNSSHNLDVTLNKKTTWNEWNEQQRSPQDRSCRDRSRRDRSPRDHPPRENPPRDHPPREHPPRDHPHRDHSWDHFFTKHSPRDRALRGHSPRERSRDHDYRRENDFQDRYPTAGRSPPRSRRDEPDVRDQNRRLANRQDERPRRPERPQRPQGPERPERPQRPGRLEDCEEDDNHHHDFDHRRLTHVDQRINQNRDNCEQGIPPKRPRSEHFQPKTAIYSSNPNNSTFIQSNANILTQKTVFQLGNIANRYDPDPRGPPSKMMRMGGIEPPRFNNPFVKLNPPAEPKGQVNTNQYREPCEDKALHGQHFKRRRLIMEASKVLSKHIIKNANTGLSRIATRDEFIVNLRKCITSRIDVVLQDNISCSLRAIIDAYRSKFSTNDDPGFVKAVIQKIERDMNDSENLESDEKSLTKDVQPGTSKTKELMPKQKPYGGKNKQKAAKRTVTLNRAASNKSNNGNNEGAAPFGQNPRLDICRPADTTGRLPKFPKGDKQIYKDQKKLQMMELNEEIYTLDPTLTKALDDAMTLLCQEYAAACEESADDKEHDSFRLRIKSETTPEFKKIVRLHVTKRLLDLPNNLVIRIFGHPKPPKRDVLDEFLKQYDVACVKKTERKYHTYFLVTCASYKCYDDLLKLGKAQLNDCTLQFRAMHLTGPKNSGQPAKMKRGKSNVPPENVIPQDEVEELLENEEVEQLLENEEVDDQVIDENGPNDDEDGDVNQNLGESTADTNIKIDNEFTSDDFTKNDDCKYNEFENWNDKPRFNDSDVELLENKHDIVVIDDNDIVEILDNDENNETTNNGHKEDELKESVGNENVCDQNINTLDDGLIEGVDVTEDDLEDF